jgi:hypothetical protein
MPGLLALPPRNPDAALPRLYRQIAGSTIGTVFYTPGGAGGWALDLLLRIYLASVRRAASLRTARASLTRAPHVAQV